MVPNLIVGLSNFHDFLPDGQWDRLIDVAQAADEAGVDALSVVDHVVLGGDVSTYPYGAFPGGLDAPWLEPIVTLAAMAGRTERVRLFTGILIAPLRPPALLAKMAATLDQLSNGRLDLGVGTGWLAKEYEALGMDFADRGGLLDDVLAACDALWRGGPTTFDSERLHFDDVYCSPLPVQRPGIPFWIAGDLHRRTIDRIVRHGVGWIPSPPTGRRDAGEGRLVLREAFTAAGRDPDSLRVRMSVPVVKTAEGIPDLERSLEVVPKLVAAGATDVFVAYSAFASGADEAPRFFSQLVPRFMDSRGA